MRRIIIREARPGMRVARQVPHPRDLSQILIPAGDPLRIEDVILLHELGVYDLWTDAPDLAYLDLLHRNSADPGQQRLIEALTRSFHALATLGITVAGNPALGRHRAALEEAVAQLAQAAPALPCFRGIVQSDELLQHSADVALLATLLGLELETYLIDQRRRLKSRAACDVLNLALGAFFHDVGETLLPPQQRESRAALAADPDAPPDWKQHTLLGHAAVRKHLDPTAAAVVLHHHQHFDGSGFACTEGRELQQRGAAIHVFARITFVADLFHHLLLDPAGVLPRPAVHTLWQLRQSPFRAWCDPTILASLLALVPPFAPGSVVTLNDRRPAVVTSVNPSSRCQPEIHLLRDLEADPAAPGSTPERIDLARSPDLRIAEVGREDVTPYLHTPLSLQPLAA